jgi:HAD superfamily hydrolase (TIGR01509 family)
MANHAAYPLHPVYPAQPDHRDHPDCPDDPTGMKPFKPLKVIVFDCDGVLFDSKEANIRFYTHVLKQVGRPPVRADQHEYIHMYPVSHSLRYLLEDDDHYHAAMSYCQGMDFKEFHAYLRCEPGLVEVLELSKSFYHTAMATNRTISTRDVLAHFDLEKYFDLVVSASDVEFPKPHPEAMLKIMGAFGAKAEEVLYVGDSSVDEGLAMATGVYFAAYKNTKLRAHMHVSHFNELLPVLNGDPSARLGLEAHFPG